MYPSLDLYQQILLKPAEVRAPMHAQVSSKLILAERLRQAQESYLAQKLVFDGAHAERSCPRRAINSASALMSCVTWP